MADNVILNAGVGGATIRAVQKGSIDTPVSILDIGGAGGEVLLSSANPMPIIVSAGAALIGQAAVAQQTNQLYNGTTALTPLYAPISASTSGDGNILVAAVAGKKIRVLRYVAAVAGAVSLKFRDFDGTSTYTDLSGVFALIANQPVPGGSYSPIGQFVTQSSHALTLNLSAGVQVSGYLAYTLE